MLVARTAAVLTMAETHVPSVEPSPATDPRMPSRGGWRAVCSCGWKGIAGRKKPGAQAEGIAHAKSKNETSGSGFPRTA